MSRILVYTSPARGHLYPITPTLLELRERGHAVVVRTLESEVEMVRGLGFTADPIDPAIEAIAHDDYLGRTPMAAVKRAMRVFCDRATHEVDDLRSAIEAERPDAVLVDVNTWGAAAVAEAWGGPWATWCPFPLPLPSRDAPPFGPGLPPARGPLGRFRDRLVRPIALGAVDREVRPRLNEIRSDLGLPALGHTTEAFTKPPALLYMTAEGFEYPRSDWPRNVVMVGPGDWEPPSRAPQWVDENEDPIVLVTTSSEFQDDGELARCALEALADMPAQVIVTVPAVDASDLRAPANARIVEFVPHSHLLPRAVCAVTHGGMGGTQKALAHGVPVCVVPFGRDQLEVARRVEIAGAGTRLPSSRLRPDRLRAQVEAAIDCRDGRAASRRGVPSDGRGRNGSGRARGGDDANGRECVKRATGIEPVMPAWKAGVLPLHHTRVGRRV